MTLTPGTRACLEVIDSARSRLRQPAPCVDPPDCAAWHDRMAEAGTWLRQVEEVLGPLLEAGRPLPQDLTAQTYDALREALHHARGEGEAVEVALARSKVRRG